MEEISISNSNSPCSLKRERDEEKLELIDEKETYCKRQKSYNDIITLLEEEEDEPIDDLSSLISTLQEEISCPGSDRTEPDPDESGPVQTGVEEVMRHLLEASDDELGIPSTSGNSSGTEMDGGVLLGGGHVDGGDLLLGVGEGLWEFEDHEANNYYNNFLHSEIFI